MNVNIRWNRSLQPYGAALAGGALLLAAACTSRDSANEFRPEGHVRSEVQNFAEVQAVAAARTHATLYKGDFNGEYLNSLGRAHIDLMLKAPESHAPLKVYLDVPDDDHAGARQQAVSAYLLARGLKQPQFDLVVGPNPDSLSPVADNLSALSNLNSGGTAGAAAESSGSSAPAASAAPTAPTMGGSN